LGRDLEDYRKEKSPGVIGGAIGYEQRSDRQRLWERMEAG